LVVMPPQILIVDDDPCTRAVIHATLSRLGYETRCAEDGRAAAALHEMMPADLVITDIFMPVMDGIELIIALRAHVDIPKVIAISGGGILCGMEALRTAKLLGADAIMEKPLSMSALVKTVATLLEARATERAAGRRRRGVRFVKEAASRAA